MIKEFISQNKFALKWIGISFAIKSILFVFFAFNFLDNWQAERVTNELFITTGDTHGYYVPLESFVHGNGYDSFCRMPGLLPFYAPLRLFLDEAGAKAGIILLQFLVSVISVYILAQTARFIFKSERAFYWTFFLYAISSFVSIWDHYGMAESFGTSFLIFSIYFLTRFKLNLALIYLFLSGLFITWSIFFRAIHGIVVPVVVLFLFQPKQITLWLKNSVIFCLPVVFSLGLWTYKNYRQYHKPVVLTGSVFDCTGFLSRELIAIRELLIAWGGDYQPWSKGSEAEWFFQSGMSSKPPAPTSRNIYTSAYNLDSLAALRTMYEKGLEDSVPAATKERYSNAILTKSRLYTDVYKKEHAFDYYVLNRLLILRKLLIPGRLDDLPLPALANMSLLQKLIKVFYFLLLIAVNLLGLAGCMLALFKGSRWPLIPLSIVFVIGVVFGYVEQRYLVPSYPFLLLFGIYLVLFLLEKIRPGKFSMTEPQ